MAAFKSATQRVSELQCFGAKSFELTVRVWGQLLQGTEEAGTPSSFLMQADNIVDELRDAVKDKFSVKLRDVDSNDLTVHRTRDGEALKVSTNIPLDTTDDAPLYIKAPSRVSVAVASISGSLFQYGSGAANTAFLCGTSASDTVDFVVFVGGLTDGLTPCEYLGPLAKALEENGSWRLCLTLTSSSFSGFGTGSLARDCEELSQLMVTLRARHHRARIVLLGHSTGCQDGVWLMGHPAIKDNLLNGLILQAPVSDREWLATQSQTGPLLSHARMLVREGKGTTLLEGGVTMDLLGAVGVSAQRFVSLADRGGDDDMFSSDYSDEELHSRLAAVTVPCLIVVSGNDEYIPEHVHKELLAKRLAASVGIPTLARALVIPGNHALADELAMSKFVAAVLEFLTSTQFPTID